MLDAIGHIALIVKDSGRTAKLFKELFGARIVERKDADGHDETYVKLGRTWFVLVQAAMDRPRRLCAESRPALVACSMVRFDAAWFTHAQCRA